LAKEIGDLTVDVSSACSDGGIKENKCNNYKLTATVDRVCAKI